MKKEFKGTKGAPTIITYTPNDDVASYEISSGRNPIGCTYAELTDAENYANAHLIAEAFNVVNECGLTPRQLAEQNKELLEALKELYSDVCEHNHNETPCVPVDTYKMETAIKNAETI